MFGTSIPRDLGVLFSVRVPSALRVINSKEVVLFDISAAAFDFVRGTDGLARDPPTLLLLRHKAVSILWVTREDVRNGAHATGDCDTRRRSAMLKILRNFDHVVAVYVSHRLSLWTTKSHYWPEGTLAIWKRMTRDSWRSFQSELIIVYIVIFRRPAQVTGCIV